MGVKHTTIDLHLRCLESTVIHSYYQRNNSPWTYTCGQESGLMDFIKPKPEGIQGLDALSLFEVRLAFTTSY